MKHITILLIALFSFIPVHSEEFIENGIKYNVITDSTVAVVKVERIGKIVIPFSIQHLDHDYVVTKIENNAFEYENKCTSLTVPSGVSDISNNSFSSCYFIDSLFWNSDANPRNVTQYCKSNLKYVQLGESVTQIGSSAFSSCSLLNTIIISSEVSTINSSAFSSCKSLDSIILPTKITQIDMLAFNGCENLTYVNIPPNVTEISASTFNGCKNLKTISIPSMVTSIGNNAFSGCSSLDSISIPASVTSIGTSSFANCTGLKFVDVQSGLISAGEKAFDGCTNIENLYWNSKVSPYVVTKNCKNSIRTVVLGDSVTLISTDVFAKCYNLSSITIPYNVYFQYGETFQGCTKIETLYWNNTHSWPDKITKYCKSNLKTVIIGDSVTSIPNEAFMNCSNLTSVTLPQSLKSIDNRAFYKCSSLSSFSIPSQVTTINDEAFYECTSLKSIVVPINVSHIGQSAFYGCTSLKSVKMPEGLTTIESGSFSGCSNLDSIIIPSNVTSIGSSAFSGCSNLKTLIIPSKVTCINQYAFAWCTNLSSISMPISVNSISNTAFYECSNVDTLFWNSNESPFCVTQYSKSNLKYVSIGDSVTIIGEDAFNGCIHLSSITLPPKTVSIKANAFKDCSGLTEISIPVSVCTIGSGAFQGCSNIMSICIPDSITTIQSDTFRDCTRLTAVTFPVSVTSIGRYAFQGCINLSDICIPNSITYIHTGTFQGCTSLNSIRIPNLVSGIEDVAFYDCSSLSSVYIYSNTPPSLGSATPRPFDGNAEGRNLYVFSDLRYSFINAPGWKDYYRNAITAIPDLTANYAGDGLGNWCTYYNSMSDVRMPDNVAIYKVSIETDRVLLTQVEGNIVSKGEAVLLNTTSDKITLLSPSGLIAGDFSGNCLKGVDVPTQQSEGKTYYVLSKVNDSFGFYKLNQESKLSPNKAYLEVSNASMAPMRSFYKIDNSNAQPTGIEGVSSSTKDRDGWYTINGIKLDEEPNTKGLFIHNGQIVVK